MTEGELGLLGSRLPWAVGISGGMAVVAFLLRTVRGAGAVLGSLLGVWVYVLAGPGSFALLAVFFVLGSLVTRMGWAAKESRGLAEKHRGARGGANIIANGGPIALLALAVFGGENSQLFLVGIAGGIAAALADTASSEVGQVYGSSPVSLTVFKKVPIGTPGAVSFEGSIAGLAAAVVIGVIAVKIGVIPLSAAPFVVVAAAVASGLESVLASFLRVEGHHVLNFLNVSLGAGLAMALWALVF